jgi:chromosome segregation ATPase
MTEMSKTLLMEESAQLRHDLDRLTAEVQNYCAGYRAKIKELEQLVNSSHDRETDLTANIIDLEKEVVRLGTEMGRLANGWDDANERLATARAVAKELLSIAFCGDAATDAEDRAAYIKSDPWLEEK